MQGNNAIVADEFKGVWKSLYRVINWDNSEVNWMRIEKLEGERGSDPCELYDEGWGWLWIRIFVRECVSLDRIVFVMYGMMSVKWNDVWWLV